MSARGLSLLRACPVPLMALVALFLGWRFTGWSPIDQSVVSASLFLPVEIWAIAAAWQASRSLEGRSAIAWRLFALAIVGQFLGGQVSHFHEWTGGSTYPLIADPLFLSFYPLMFAGLLIMRPADERQTRKARLALDIATVALGGGAAVWYLVIHPTATTAGQDPLQTAISLAYPIGDLILIVGVVQLLLRGVTPAANGALTLLAGGLTLFVVGDIAYAYVTLQGTYASGDLLDTTYFIAFALFVVAARARRLGAIAATSGRERADARRVSWIPYVGVLTGFAVLLSAELSDDFTPDGILALSACLIAVLVSARQLLAQHELVVAQRALERAHADLERAYQAEQAAAAERERMELELRLAQKLEAVGQLAAGIAHEINTPIQFIGDTTRFVADAFDDLFRVLDADAQLRLAARSGPVPGELLDRVEAVTADADLEYLRERLPSACVRLMDGVDRVAGIVSAMRTFAHPSTETGPVDVNESIRTTLVVAANEYKYVADAVTDLATLRPVLGSAGDINQVLLNLIVNAAHAIADAPDASGRRGTIEVRTREVGEAAEITVTDTGCGIPPELGERVFDPFFTTKDVGRGTGQGLAIAHAIVVDRHGGTLSFDSAPGHGTTFTVRLPLVPSMSCS